MECMMRFIHDSKISHKVFDWIDRIIPDHPTLKTILMD